MTFDDFWNQAVQYHGDERLITQRFPVIKDASQLTQLSDAECLSLMTRRVFRAGMKHSLVDSKWPAFEQAFWGFSPEACRLIDGARFDVLMQDRALIRHWGKMKTIPVNAQFVLDVSQEYGSFSTFLAHWPTDNIVGLWTIIKKRGAYLGGDGASRLLRMIGKDTFVLTDDVVRALKNAGVVDSKPTSQKALKAVQSFFNELQKESSLPMSAISVVLAMSIGPN